MALSRILDSVGILHLCMVNRKYSSRLRIEPATGNRSSSKCPNNKWEWIVLRFELRSLGVFWLVCWRSLVAGWVKITISDSQFRVDFHGAWEAHIVRDYKPHAPQFQANNNNSSCRFASVRILHVVWHASLLGRPGYSSDDWSYYTR